ncbi:MAG: hypothetical protein HN348_28485, partial [Proteobacteria bacterium]|nr:hypothetical protein [Pseudomonadota bacterium]
GSESRSTKQVLGFYSVQGVELALQRYGLLDTIRSMGFEALRLEHDAGDSGYPTLRIRGRMGIAGPMVLLMELVVRRKKLPRPASSQLEGNLEVIWIDWLLLQDPSANFSLARPPLPGQEHPGLGIAHQVQELLVQACRRINLDGLSNNPAHYHNALGASRVFYFLEPEDQGRFKALYTTLKDRDLAEASALADDKQLCLSDGTRLGWEPNIQVLPVSKRLQLWVESDAYQEIAKATQDKLMELGLTIAK